MDGSQEKIDWLSTPRSFLWKVGMSGGGVLLVMTLFVLGISLMPKSTDAAEREAQAAAVAKMGGAAVGIIGIGGAFWVKFIFSRPSK